jgi:MFS family permease
MNRPWLKAGLIGGGVLILLNLLSVIPLPLLGCLTFLLEIVAFIGVGALAAYWFPPPRLSGRAAGQGALAGLLMGIIGALASTLLARWAPRSPRQQRHHGTRCHPKPSCSSSRPALTAVLFGSGTRPATAVCCFPAGAIIGAAQGALGGLIYASANPGKVPPPAYVDDSPQLPPDV